MIDAQELTTLDPGPVQVGPNGVEFGLYAPGKQRVALVGAFNGWDAAADPLEEQDGLWRLRKVLPQGRHEYGFDVDGIRIADPYAREAEWPSKDNPRSFVTVGAPAFQWQHEAISTPAYQDLIIYEILVQDFSPEHSFQGVIERLDHLERLGVNTIELMPITSGPPRDNWGYHPVFMFAPDDRYGRPDDLRRLVDAAHGRGLAVIMDICIAHTGHKHSFNQLYYFHESPWYGQPFGGDNEFGLPSFDHSKPATQAFCREVLHFWLREFRIDGYRLDYAKLIGERNGMGIPKVLRDIRQVKPEAYIVTEVLPERPELVNRWDVNGAWHESLQNALGDNLTLDLVPEEKRAAQKTWRHLLRALNPVEEQYCNADLCVNFVGNHDEERMMRVLTEKGLEPDAAVKRIELATALVFTMAGPPLMFHGEEWGESTKKELGPNPIHWELLDSAAGRRLFTFFQRVIQLRWETPALRSPFVEINGTDPDTRCLAMRRWSGPMDAPESEAVVVANLSTETQEMPLRLRAGVWRNAASGEEIAGREIVRRLESFGHEIWVRV